MFFPCCVNRVFNLLFHGLAAADEHTLAGVKNFNDIAADFTFINQPFQGDIKYAELYS
jgi:hypothetical protein